LTDVVAMIVEPGCKWDCRLDDPEHGIDVGLECRIELLRGNGEDGILRAMAMAL
jgi:hypothetical protein